MFFRCFRVDCSSDPPLTVAPLPGRHARVLATCACVAETVIATPRKISNPSVLEGQFSEEEIKRSVFSLPGKKSPRPDGFPLCFYQTFWNDIKLDIFDMFDHFYNSNDIDTLRSINQTFIALIPKETNVEKIQDYRPISLLNRSYKVISKCLAARLSPILNSLLDDS